MKGVKKDIKEGKWECEASKVLLSLSDCWVGVDTEYLLDRLCDAEYQKLSNEQRRSYRHVGSEEDLRAVVREAVGDEVAYRKTLLKLKFTERRQRALDAGKEVVGPHQAHVAREEVEAALDGVSVKSHRHSPTGRWKKATGLMYPHG